ncbi:MAG: PTS glucose transporter subunit IIA, partial [Ruminococcus sp.]
ASNNLDEIFEESKAEVKQEKAEENKNTSTDNDNSKAEVLYSHLTGEVVPLENVEDAVFSNKVIGDGIAVEPTVGELYAPCDGKVDTVFDTKHAVSLISEKGCNMILHIGIDTVKLNGQFFESHVNSGQQVKKGDLLITFDIDEIKKAGYKVTTPMVICNTPDYSEFNHCKAGAITAGNKILEIK